MADELLSDAMSRSIAAHEYGRRRAELEAVPPGPCGSAMPADAGELLVTCRLRARHAGWHEADYGATWSPAIDDRAAHEQIVLGVLRQRDKYHKVADRLAEAIASHLGIDIGEHSSMNDPWQNALDALTSRRALDLRESS